MMKLKEWVKVIEKGDTEYPIVRKFLQNNYGQETKKSGTNEKEHCILYWTSEGKDQEKDYTCSRLQCHEMLLHIAAAFGVPEEQLEQLYEMAKGYVEEHGRSLKGISVIAGETMKMVEETEAYKNRCQK